MEVKPIFITTEGLKKLEEELEHLRTVKRSELARQLREAIDEGGDINENVAYEIAKNNQAFLEGRIRELEGKLAWARLVELDTKTELVQFGSTVVIRDINGMRLTFKIVGPTEANPRNGLISYESPLGQALLERRAGEEILVNAPAGTLRFRILSVS
jgi:transcription elongation factor GreA